MQKANHDFMKYSRRRGGGQHRMCALVPGAIGIRWWAILKCEHQQQQATVAGLVAAPFGAADLNQAFNLESGEMLALVVRTAGRCRRE
jgi:hypothetical protein